MSVIAPLQVSFKEILLATDLSEKSENTINYAKAIAKRFDSHILLVHVGQSTNPILIPEGEWFEDQSTSQIERQVEAVGVALRAEGYSAEAVNTCGNITSEIHTLAEAHHVDLVILGTHGRRGLNRLLFRPRAELLLRHSQCPTLTVGPSAGPAPREGWAPKNILCVTWIKSPAGNSLSYSYRLAQRLGASLSLLPIREPNDPSGQEGSRAFETTVVKALSNEERADIRIHDPLSGKDSAAKIVEVVRALQVDLIVVCAGSLSFGVMSLSSGPLDKLMVDAPCPVLTLNTADSHTL